MEILKTKQGYFIRNKLDIKKLKKIPEKTVLRLINEGVKVRWSLGNRNQDITEKILKLLRKKENEQFLSGS